MESILIKIRNPDNETLGQGVDTKKYYAPKIQHRKDGESRICYIAHPMHPEGSGKLLAIMPWEYDDVVEPDKCPSAEDMVEILLTKRKN